MKRFLITLTLAMLVMGASAQKDITKFLGIPVDGTKAEMIQKLKAKGFTRSRVMEDALEGQFNGKDVYISVVTNNNKVYRIAVSDVNNVDEQDIKIRFNTLCSQFANNPKYLTLKDFSIPENENIGYEILVNKKRFQANYYQLPTDTVAFQNRIYSKISAKYTAEQIANRTDEIESELYNCILEEYSNRLVWFMISEFRGKYYIDMYYDNVYNQANGEDL